MPTFVILPYKIQPPTLAFQELCHEYLAIFGISTKTVMECVSHHKNGEDLFHQAVIAYTSMLIQKLSDSEENNFFIRTEAGTANVLEKLAGHVKMFMAGNTQAEGMYLCLLFAVKTGSWWNILHHFVFLFYFFLDSK